MFGIIASSLTKGLMQVQSLPRMIIMDEIGKQVSCQERGLLERLYSSVGYYFPK